MMRARTLVSAVLVLSLSACQGNPDTLGGRAADARHESFEELGEAMKALGDEVKAGAGDLALIRSKAAEINALAVRLPEWFPAGSGPQDGMKTDTLADVWTKPAEFKAASDKFTAEAAKFNSLAQAGDKAALGPGMQALGGTCKDCHDKFKKED